MDLNFEHLINFAVARGFRRAGGGSRLEGHGFWIEHDRSGNVKVSVTYKTDNVTRPLTDMSINECMAWLGRNEWPTKE